MTTRVSEGPLRDRVHFRKGPWGDTLPSHACPNCPPTPPSTHLPDHLRPAPPHCASARGRLQLEGEDGVSSLGSVGIGCLTNVCRHDRPDCVLRGYRANVVWN